MFQSVAGKLAVGIVCCWGVAFAALIFFYAVNPWIDHKEIPVFGSRSSDTALFGAPGLVCVFFDPVGLVDGIRGEYNDTWLGSFSSLFLSVRSDRFRTFEERVRAWAFHHFDNS